MIAGHTDAPEATKEIIENLRHEVTAGTYAAQVVVNTSNGKQELPS